MDEWVEGVPAETVAAKVGALRGMLNLIYGRRSEKLLTGGSRVTASPTNLDFLLARHAFPIILRAA